MFLGFSGRDTAQEGKNDRQNYPDENRSGLSVPVVDRVAFDRCNARHRVGSVVAVAAVEQRMLCACGCIGESATLSECCRLRIRMVGRIIAARVNAGDRR